MKKFIAITLVILNCFNAFAQSKHSKTSAFKSYRGLVMAGYQGWFNAMGDGANRGWNHYHGHDGFQPGSIKVDLWPDVSEYSKTYETPFKHADGSPAYLFSSWDYSSVDLHFKWMQQYGIDGVFVQRFVTNVINNPVSLNANDRVLDNALKASEKYHRAIAVMYDFSGMKDDDYPKVIADWKHLIDSLNITGKGNDQTYLYHNGKPLVALWGVGFNDHRKYTLSSVEKIIDFLQHDPVYGGCSILLGVPTYWRTAGKDTDPDPHLLDVLKTVDIVHPWFVGRYNEDTYPQFIDNIKGDIAWCKANKVDYAPVVYPGFSWHNMYPSGPQNQIPRNRGNFYWKQINGAISNGAQMLYVAMFDEIDEGTAIFKISKNPPTGLSTFVKFEDDIPNDYYLYLTGYAAKILKKQAKLTATVPSPKNTN